MTEQTEQQPACPAEYEWIKPGAVTWHFSGHKEACVGTVDEPPFYSPECAGYEDEFGDVWDGWMYSTRESPMIEYCCSAARAAKPPTPPDELTTLRAEVARLSEEVERLKSHDDARDQMVVEACDERNDLLQRLAGLSEMVEDHDQTLRMSIGLLYTESRPGAYVYGEELKCFRKTLREALLETNETEKEESGK